MQRLMQMNVVPDLLPAIDLTVDMELFFGRHRVQPGMIVPSALTEQPPKLIIQPFDQGMHLYTIAVVDPDVPNVENDGFDSRCHFLAINVPLSPTDTKISLGQIAASEALSVQPWMSPYAQKGSPYHRLCMFALRQQQGMTIDVGNAKARLAVEREQNRPFKFKGLLDRYRLNPVGGYIFRTTWDEHMDSLMASMGVEGSGVELKRKRILPLPYEKKPSDGEKYR